MVSEISSDQMAAYRAHARRRRQLRAEAVAQRRERAWALAREGARLLRTEFGASRVVVFGSILHPEKFHERSDVDLAVWGLDEALYYRAVSYLLGLQPDISVDLIDTRHASPDLLTVIEQGGVSP